MAVHWQIKFKSLRASTDYTVNIYDSTYSSDPIQLKGGAQPFTTQESDDEDQFIPTRTQSGYLRIVDDGTFNWKQILPSTDVDRPVTLTAGSTVVWRGFMQAQNFGSTLYGNPQERELPVQCILSAMSSSDVDITNKELKPFAYYLYQCFTSIGVGVSGSVMENVNYYFQGGVNVREWLMKLVDAQNFINDLGDDEIEPAYDLLTVLEDICRFWGWTCQTCGQNVYFTSSDDRTNMPGFLKLDASQLRNMALNGMTSVGTIESYGDISMSGDIFASTDNEESMVRGYNRATVKADANSGETKIIEAFPDTVAKTMADGGYSVESDDDKRLAVTPDLLTFDTIFLSGSCQSGYASFNLGRVYNEGESVTNGENTINLIRIKRSFANSAATAYASMETVYHHNFYDPRGENRVFGNNSGLQLHGKVYRKAHKFEDPDNHDETVGNKTMYVRLGIGKTYGTALWWNGRNAWTQTKTAFKVTIGGTGDIFVCRYDGSAGHATTHEYIRGIPCTNVALQGKMFIEFIGSDDIDEINGVRSFEIADFYVEYVRNIYKGHGSTFGYGNTLSDIKEYTANNQGKASEEWNADCIYASDNEMSFGYGVPTNADGSLLTTVTYGSTDKHPEQHLADRVANYWSTSKRKLYTELRTNVINVPTPQDMVTIDATTGHPISISREWRDDILQLTLLES